jgi:hypothetical protein
MSLSGVNLSKVDIYWKKLAKLFIPKNNRKKDEKDFACVLSIVPSRCLSCLLSCSKNPQSLAAFHFTAVTLSLEKEKAK